MSTLTAGQVEPVEPAWYIGSTAVDTSAAAVTFREFSTGSARYWTGSAWSSTPTSLALTGGRYLLTVPASWQGLVVDVICTLTGYPDLTDEIVVQTPSSDPHMHADLT